MKLVNKNNNWREIDKIILLVNNVEINYATNLSLGISCSFENISKGRCNIEVLEKKKNNFDNLFVYTDKPLMVVKIFYSKEEIEKLTKVLSLNRNNSKKIKVSLCISDNLMINDSGYLYVKNNLEIEIKSKSWSIPII